MKVSITIVVDIDPEAWDIAYGTGVDAPSVRQDVKEYILGAIQGLRAVDEGGIRGVSTKHWTTTGA